MEVKIIVNKIKNEYQKIQQIRKKNLSYSIPNKWLKVVLSSIGILMIMKNNAFAIETDMMDEHRPSIILQICNVACPILQITSAVIFIITILNILITKIKAKKQNETKKVKKWVKVLFIISIIAFILSIWTNFIVYIIIPINAK